MQVPLVLFFVFHEGLLPETDREHAGMFRPSIAGDEEAFQCFSDLAVLFEGIEIAPWLFVVLLGAQRAASKNVAIFSGSTGRSLNARGTSGR